MSYNIPDFLVRTTVILLSRFHGLVFFACKPVSVIMTVLVKNRRAVLCSDTLPELGWRRTDMPTDIINIANKLGRINEVSTPKVIARINDYLVKLVKFKCEFIWHVHDDSDELFYILSGDLEVHFRSGVKKMKPGDMMVIPKGVEHKPFATEECHMMVIEPEGVLNTGNVENEQTLKKLDWI